MSIRLAGKDRSLELAHFHECFVVVVYVGNAEDIGFIPQQGYSNVSWQATVS